jgi:hypothetical protein
MITESPGQQAGTLPLLIHATGMAPPIRRNWDHATDATRLKSRDWDTAGSMTHRHGTNESANIPGRKTPAPLQTHKRIEKKHRYVGRLRQVNGSREREIDPVLHS